MQVEILEGVVDVKQSYKSSIVAFSLTRQVSSKLLALA
jgi:hypothetical protein